MQPNKRYWLFPTYDCFELDSQNSHISISGHLWPHTYVKGVKSELLYLIEKPLRSNHSRNLYVQWLTLVSMEV